MCVFLFSLSLVAFYRLGKKVKTYKKRTESNRKRALRAPRFKQLHSNVHIAQIYSNSHFLLLVFLLLLIKISRSLSFSHMSFPQHCLLLLLLPNLNTFTCTTEKSGKKIRYYFQFYIYIYLYFLIILFHHFTLVYHS